MRELIVTILTLIFSIFEGVLIGVSLNELICYKKDIKRNIVCITITLITFIIYFLVIKEIFKT